MNFLQGNATFLRASRIRCSEPQSSVHRVAIIRRPCPRSLQRISRLRPTITATRCIRAATEIAIFGCVPALIARERRSNWARRCPFLCPARQAQPQSQPACAGADKCRPVARSLRPVSRSVSQLKPISAPPAPDKCKPPHLMHCCESGRSRAQLTRPAPRLRLYGEFTSRLPAQGGAVRSDTTIG